MLSCGPGSTKKEEEKKDSVAGVIPSTIDENNELSEVITRFVRAYASRDNDKVNRLVHPDLGFTIIYRPGASDTFVRIDSINFAKAMPEYYPYPNIQNDYVLVFEKLPEFDCGTEKWSKLGFFCDTTSHPNQLSNIAAFEKEFDESIFSEEQLDNLERNEAQSYRIIVTTKDPLIFHVQRYKGGWYVTALDRAYAGCDA
ncbi:hypothetical protein M472_04400 [Sphingobacterium paucimobilis HER1398]|uniref:Uncharacterized protein n=1 Tax=Sphingobacterium paucimobilis HER1398 TaxID=1346330 RepID=U2HRU2_9SPHI|nr:hypothetical protein M472_04400 [Sphingobacterium paucimobilis HER1398]